jgi:hypothetical protein
MTMVRSSLLWTLRDWGKQTVVMIFLQGTYTVRNA